MALTTNLAREKYTGDGSTNVFYFHFAVWETSEIKVYTGNDTSETQVLSGITIVLTGQPGGAGTKASGGYVTFATAPASGLKIAIVRSMPFIQEDVYTSGSRFDAHEVEDRLDEDCAERQELLDKVTRSIKVPGTSDLTPEQFSQSLLDASQTAVQKAAEAASSASSAASSAANASISAGSAASSATSAGNSASSAANSATNASSFAANAGNYAAAASSSAASSAASATTSYNHSEDSRKWAVGTLFEQPAGSSKYWANIAQQIMGNTPTINRWVRTTVIGQKVYNLDNPNPTSSDATKYLVFYGTDLLNTGDYTIDSVSNPKTITLSEAPQEVLTLTVAFISQAVVAAGSSSIGTIFSVIGCEDAYIPYGAVPCNGAEYSKSTYPDLYTFLTQATPYLKSCNYTEYAAEVAAYFSCAKWGLDTANEKFKVPTIQNGTYLQQAQTSTESGKAYKGAVVYGQENQTRAVTVRYFVQMVNAGSSGGGSAANKVDRSGDTMTGALHVPTPPSSSNDTTVPTTEWVLSKITTPPNCVAKSGDTMTGALHVPQPAASLNDDTVATTQWVRNCIAQYLSDNNYVRAKD